MAQDIVVNYRADVDDLTNKLKVVIERMDKLEKESVASAKGIDQVTKSTDQLDKELSTLGTSSKKATDNIKGFSKTVKSELGGVQKNIKSVGSEIALTLGAAFTVGAVVEFGKASVNAFIEAEENANKLKFAVTQIAGESEAAFQRLIKQSEQLQKATIFSDDSIQQAQAALSTFGLTAEKIEEVIPLLADFATITGQDIPQAAQALGQAIQGRAGEFKKFGVDVSESATEVENLANIITVLKTQQGAANEATKTFAGQIRQARNAIDDLQESLGKGIVSYVKTFIDVIKPSIDRIIENVTKLFGLFRSGKDATDQASSGLETLKTVVEVITLPLRALLTVVGFVTDGILLLARTASGTAAAIKVAFTGIGETVRNVGSAIGGVFDGITSFDGKKIKDAVAGLTTPIKDLGADISAAFKEGFSLDVTKEVEKATDAVIASEEKLLTQRELQKASLKELTKLLEQYGKQNTVTGRSNLKLVQDEIAIRKKQTEELEKEAAKQLEALKKLYGDVQKIPPIELKVKFDTEDPDKSINPLPDTLELPPVDAGEFNDSIEAVEAKTLAGWLDNNAQMLDATTNLVNSLLGLWDLYTQKQIEDIQKVTDQQLTNLDEQGKANQDSLNKRRITETEFAILQEKLEKQKVQAQEDADKKIRALKRKQAIADKAAALIQIAIDTARAYAETIGQAGFAGIPLGAIVLAAGAAQAAFVAAQPIPYRRGSKDTGAKGHMAKVGEEGEEIVYMPAHSKVLPAHRTRTYGDVLDKMFEGTFDKHYMKRDISSSLVSQRRNFEEKKEKSFAQNIKESIIYQQTGLTEYELERVRRRGQNVTNANEIGQSVARAISQTIDIYRR